MIDIVIYNPKQERFVKAVFQDQAFTKRDKQEALNELIVLIGTWVYKLGVKRAEVPNADETLTLATWIYDNYNMLTFKEIELAIDLSLLNKLDIATTNLFGGTLSVQYISTVLNAYKEYRYPRMMKIADQTADYVYKNALPSPKPLPEEEVKQMRQIVSTEYHRYKTTGQLIDFNNIMWNYFKFSKILNATVAAKNEAMKHAEEKLINMLKEPIRKDKLALGQWFNHHVRLIFQNDPEEAKKLYAREYIMKWFFDKTDLQVILDKIVVEHFLPNKIISNGSELVPTKTA